VSKNCQRQLKTLQAGSCRTEPNRTAANRMDRRLPRQEPKGRLHNRLGWASRVTHTMADTLHIILQSILIPSILTCSHPRRTSPHYLWSRQERNFRAINMSPAIAKSRNLADSFVSFRSCCQRQLLWIYWLPNNGLMGRGYRWHGFQSAPLKSRSSRPPKMLLIWLHALVTKFAKGWEKITIE